MQSTSIPFARASISVVALIATATPLRAQIFEYAVKNPGYTGSLGASVARMGDLNFDGYDDILVGEPAISYSSGAFSIISGADGSSLAYYYSTSQIQFGAAVEGKIDIDLDGWPDALIGAPGDGIYPGAVVAFSSRTRSWGYGAGGSDFGTSIRRLAGDLDGDGVEDFIGGAPSGDLVYVISSATLFTSTPMYIYKKTGQSGSNFGRAVSRGGNLDGDGIADFLIGSPAYVDSLGNTVGRISAFAGKDGSKLWTTDGVADSEFGHAADAIDDVDGDSYTDIAVGAPKHLDGGGVKTGCVTVLSGLTGNVLYKVFGDNANDDFGHAVRSADGDIDGDGIKDFIAGAPQLSGSDVGYARTISGATGDVIVTYTQHNNGKSDYGSAVAGGNFLGGTRPDVVIGGPSYSGGDGIAEVWRTFAANWNNYGSGWAGTNGVPTFTPRSDPVVGKDLKIDLENSLGTPTSGLLLIGVAKASIQTNKGGKLLVDPLIFVPLAIPAKGAVIAGTVPDDPSLYGVDGFFQALELDPGASKGVSFTQGLDLSFGGP